MAKTIRQASLAPKPTVKSILDEYSRVGTFQIIGKAYVVAEEYLEDPFVQQWMEDEGLTADMTTARADINRHYVQFVNNNPPLTAHISALRQTSQALRDSRSSTTSPTNYKDFVTKFISIMKTFSDAANQTLTNLDLLSDDDYYQRHASSS